MYKYLSVNSAICLIVLVAFFNFSCSTQKDTRLFQTIPYNSELQTLITKDFEHKVKVDDILLITIVSPSAEAPKYNISPEGYLVDKNGNIQLYNFGNVKVGGLTISQVKDRITRLLVPDIFKEVAISAKFKNHKIIVMGEVGAQGVVPLETEHISILEAITQQGGLNQNARRDNILVIRNTEKGKIFYRVNLLDGSIFNSNFYYLQAEDIVYVEPEEKKKDAGASAAMIFSYVISGLSFFFLIFDRINN